MNKSLSFLCGALRSGTSMTHLMLNAHSKVSNPGEFDFFFDLLAQKGREPSVKEFVNYLSVDRIFLSKNLRVDSSATSYGDIIKGFVEQLQAENEVLCLNLHRNFDLAYRYFPDAKFIHMLRDPRDVALSSIGMGWAGNVYYGVKHWVQTEDSWQRLISSLGGSKYAEVCFEDLVREPEHHLANICTLLGLEYEQEMLEYDKNTTYSKPDASLINQWQRKLEGRDLELVEFQAQEHMRINGYAQTIEKPRAPAIKERIGLRLENVLYREKVGATSYGFWLHLALKITSKLGLSQLQRPYLAKQRAITQRKLK